MTQSELTCESKKLKIKYLSDNKIEQADRGREYTLSPRFGTLINILNQIKIEGNQIELQYPTFIKLNKNEKTTKS